MTQRHARPFIKRVFGRIQTETPFNAGWVDAIKQIIPQQYRKHEGGSIWSFDPRYYSCVKTISLHFFGNNIIDSTGGIPEPQTSGWKEAWEVYKEVLRNSGFKQESQRQAPPPRTQPNKVSAAYATLFLAENAPKEVVTAVIRSLRVKFHPDTGGDTEVMARINGAYDLLVKMGRA